MFNAILTAVLLGIINLAIVFFVFFVINRRLEALIASIASYFSPHNGNPSEFAQVTEQIAAQFADKAVTQVKMSFLGQQSVEARNAKRLEGDLAMDLASQSSPLIGALLSSFPAVAKRLQKNPELLPVAQGLIEKFMSKQGNNPAPAPMVLPQNNGNGDFANRMSRYNG